MVPAARICPSFGSTSLPLSSAGEMHLVGPSLTPSAVEGPVTNTCWRWLGFLLAPCLCFPICKTEMTLISSPEQRGCAVYPLGSIFRWLGEGRSGRVGVITGMAPSAAPTALSLLAVWAVLLRSILFYFIFQIKAGRL